MKIQKNIKSLSDEIYQVIDDFGIITNLNANKNINIKNINGSLKSFFINYLVNNYYNKIIIIVENSEKAVEFQNDFETLNTTIPIFSMFDIKKSESSLSNSINHILNDLTKKIINNEPLILLINKDILELNVQNPNDYEVKKLNLEIGLNYNFNNLISELMELSFERVDYVSQVGEFAVRGGIIDIFPITFDHPIRIELWGEEIESIREFDVTSQRSIKSLNQASISSYTKINDNPKVNFYNLISNNFRLIIDDIEFYNNNLKELSNNNNYIIFNGLDKASYDFKSKIQRNYNASAKELTKDILDKKIDFTYYLTFESKKHLERLYNILHSSLELDFNIDENKIDPILDNITWIPNFLSSGFILNNISVLAEHEIFNRNKKTSKNAKSNSRTLLQELTSLKNGDYIVHEDKGIARFQGFRTINIGDSTQDCIQLEFEGGDLLYVNMNYINKIQRYSAQEGLVPKVSKLGSSEWERRKIRHKKRIKEIARELISLYAKRKMQPGYMFDKDSVWQKEFEASFIYDDTIDQLNATEDIKKDMESPMPMDRLLCGDVGFGKTEIAIRAAFKAVQSGKQVAILVPTTILAHQHIMSFNDRLSRYPVKTEVLSRFVPKKKQNDIVQNLKLGKVDILIGTHRILSKDIEFKNLGLLVVDEEQRFGVSAKEKLREMRVSIDTLTLTATPIPRTLNFSLLGARDLSVMETPPKNRLPVYTEIVEWEEDRVNEFISNEVKRGGQVFFVNDKIQDLELIMLDLKKTNPKIKFGLAHGQMQSKELENVMQKFISGELDVLCTTKIVESGLDIPNANTMIINKAQNFGLAELYQLRGRVGRSNQQAFCYLMIPKNYKLNQTSVKRLQAIEEFTDLGSGFQIALRDMEIRGAGNLLGAEQSGAIYDIGFELYQKVLDEAVNELKNEEFKELFKKDDNNLIENISNKNVAIEISDDCLIPEDYISSDTQRFEIYKNLYKFESNKELNELEQELVDKFGKLPQELKNLLYVIKVRIQAIKTGIEKIIIKENHFIIELPNSDNDSFYNHIFPLFLDFIQTIGSSQLLQNKQKLSIKIPIKRKEEVIEILWKLNKVIEGIEIE